MLCMWLNFIIILFSLSGNENPMAGQSAMLCCFILPELLRNTCLNCLQQEKTDGLSSDSLHTFNTCITEHANYFDHHNDDCGPLIT